MLSNLRSVVQRTFELSLESGCGPLNQNHDPREGVLPLTFEEIALLNSVLHQPNLCQRLITPDAFAFAAQRAVQRQALSGLRALPYPLWLQLTENCGVFVSFVDEYVLGFFFEFAGDAYRVVSFRMPIIGEQFFQRDPFNYNAEVDGDFGLQTPLRFIYTLLHLMQNPMLTVRAEAHQGRAVHVVGNALERSRTQTVRLTRPQPRRERGARPNCTPIGDDRIERRRRAFHEVRAFVRERNGRVEHVRAHSRGDRNRLVLNARVVV